MATLSQAKTLGGIGSILIFIPFVSVVGYILIIVAVKEISDDLKDKTIFTNVVISAVTGIVGALAGGFVIVLGVLASGFTFGVAGIGGLISGLLIAWIALIVSAIFLKAGLRFYGPGARSRDLQDGRITLPGGSGPYHRARGFPRAVHC